jgi:hypothetical protein
MEKQTVIAAIPKTQEIRGTLRLSHYVCSEPCPEYNRSFGRYASLYTYYQTKPSDIEKVIRMFRDANPQFDDIAIHSTFSYVLRDIHHKD